MFEDALLRSIKKLGGNPGRHIRLGIGDDGALLRIPPGEDLVVSQDALVEGQDFRKSWGSPEEIGYKAAAAALSDLAAMGARPLGAALTLILPPSWKAGPALSLVRGFSACVKKFGAALVGGDLSAGTGPLVLDAVVLGSVLKGRELRRDGARPGDLLAVTGRLGAPKAALEFLLENKKPPAGFRARFFRPEPRIGLAWVLSSERLLTAAMDISDGLGLDLRRFCQASGVGVELNASSLPLHPWVFHRSRSKGTPVSTLPRKLGSCAAAPRHSYTDMGASIG